MSNQTETVEPNTETEGKKREPKVRVAFLSLMEGDAIDAEGKIVGVPEGYDSKEHLAPKRTDFANDADFLDFQANIFDAVAAEKSERAEMYRTQATELRKYGDPEQRKQVQKFQKMAEALKALQGTLASSGVEVDLEALLAD
tara:strand:- start:28495 stop:28920 length:426 start_codon:yes stop_codon:yes gene_type:complete